MKYTFPCGDSIKTVNIPDEWIKKTKINLNLSTSEAIELWMCDNGYEENMEQMALNSKAKEVGIDAGVTRKKRKAPERKPDEVKRSIIAGLHEYISEFPEVRDPQVTNVERIITFSLGDDKYELTLSKKRKPKE